MKTAAWIIPAALLCLAAGAFAQDKHPAGHGAAGTPGAPKKAEDDLQELKNLTMEAIRKEGKVQELSPGAVHIPPERQQLIGVRLGTAAPRNLDKTIRTVGRVDYDEKRIGTVSPKVGGWIEELYADFTGRFVKKGDPLLTIYSPELVSTQEEYLLALRARESWERSSFPEVSESGSLLVDSARRRLKLWDITERQIRALEERGEVQKTLTLFSPFSGVVVEKTVNRGMYVMPGAALFKVADLSVVWLIADIYEYELPHIRLGQQASVELPYFPSEAFTGKAIYIYPYLDPQTRTARVRFEFPNPRGRLKPEMFADVVIRVALGTRLSIPESAVIDTGARKLAILARGEGYFEPREVKLGVKSDDYVEVVSGLVSGDPIVVSANFLIDSETRLKEAIGGGGHQH
jgi:Cu(I)/Ag(I) efflux system membrane fusion protein